MRRFSNLQILPRTDIDHRRTMLRRNQRMIQLAVLTVVERPCRWFNRPFLVEGDFLSLRLFEKGLRDQTTGTQAHVRKKRTVWGDLLRDRRRCAVSHRRLVAS